MKEKMDELLGLLKKQPSFQVRMRLEELEIREYGIGEASDENNTIVRTWRFHKGSGNSFEQCVENAIKYLNWRATEPSK